MTATFQIKDAACTKCTFFDVKPSSNDGLCRFNPPISQTSADAHGLWPVVAAQDWCGHFEAQATA